MVRENPRITQIAQLLRSGKYAEADSLIVQESSRVKTQISDLKIKIVSCEASLATLRSLLPESGQQDLLASQPATSIKLTKSQKHKRRQEILRVALMVADDIGSFSSEDIARVLASEGVPMGVPPNRVNTAVGSFLRGNPEFEKDVENEGLYKKKVQSVDVEEDVTESASNHDRNPN